MNISRDDRPIFVLSNYRSGSTLLRYLLDAHPNIVCPPESQFILGLETFLDYPQTLQGLNELGFPEDEVHRRLKDLIESYLGGYAEQMRKSRWAEMTPYYYRIPPLIDRIFLGEAIYLILVRHPLDFIQSSDEQFNQSWHQRDAQVAINMQRYGRGRFGQARCWVDNYERIYKFASARPDRAIVIQYEDLVFDGHATAERLFGFVGEEFTANILETAFNRFHTFEFQDPEIGRTVRIHDQSIGRWGEWPTSETTALWRQVEDIAVLFGYTSP